MDKILQAVYQQAIPKSQHFNMVYQIRFESKLGRINGSALVWNVGEKAYLITARHIFNGEFADSGDTFPLSIHYNGKWITPKGQVYFSENKEIDIAVLPMGTKKSISFETIDQENARPILGQDVFFYGYPFGRAIKNSTNNPNMAMVRKGILSGEEVSSGKIFIDGNNSDGLSGGVVVFKDLFSGKYGILGIISSYLGEAKEVIPIRSSGGQYEVNENSGLFYCYGLNHALDIINKI